MIDRVNKRGFDVEDGPEKISISAYTMLRRRAYLDLPPVKHRGVPTLENFSAAGSKGYLLRTFDIASYIRHCGRGIARRFGYGLGFRRKLDYLLSEVVL
jgi:hypothetical protein